MDFARGRRWRVGSRLAATVQEVFPAWLALLGEIPWEGRRAFLTCSSQGDIAWGASFAFPLQRHTTPAELSTTEYDSRPLEGTAGGMGGPRSGEISRNFSAGHGTHVSPSACVAAKRTA